MTRGEPAADPRFSRQVRFAPLGPDGQASLLQARALLVGAGALGTHIADALVRAGVGELWLVDRDVVEVDNLPRQILFTEEDAAEGRPKAHAAAARLAAVRAECQLHPMAEEFDAETFARLPTPDVILDGTDNFATRYLINDLAHRAGIPWVYGGAVGARGTAMAVLPGETPCLRCLVPQAPPAGEIANCETAGVLAPAVAMVAAFQTAQALKILSGRSADVARGALDVDVWNDRYALRLADGRPAADCVACGAGEYPALQPGHRSATRLCGRRAVQVQPPNGATLDLERIAAGLAPLAQDLQLTPHLLRFSIEGCRFSVFRGGRALLFGVDEPTRAQILYDRYVGTAG
ncbi:MAG: ThiF family adenylyltransferase [Planctomycetota bacterium]